MQFPWPLVQLTWRWSMEMQCVLSASLLSTTLSMPAVPMKATVKFWPQMTDSGALSMEGLGCPVRRYGGVYTCSPCTA